MVRVICSWYICNLKSNLRSVILRLGVNVRLNCFKVKSLSLIYHVTQKTSSKGEGEICTYNKT